MKHARVEPPNCIPGKIRKKLSTLDGGREWGASLTPGEIVLLADLKGVQPHSGDAVDRARADVKAGRGNPTWFYFTVAR